MRACGSSGELRPQMRPGINNSMWSHLCSCVLTDSWRNLSVSLRFLQQGQEFIRCDKKKTEAGRRVHKSECPVLKISQIIPSSQHLAVNYCTWTRIWWGNKEFRQQLPAFCTELQNLLCPFASQRMELWLRGHRRLRSPQGMVWGILQTISPALSQPGPAVAGGMDLTDILRLIILKCPLDKSGQEFLGHAHLEVQQAPKHCRVQFPLHPAAPEVLSLRFCPFQQQECGWA